MISDFTIAKQVDSLPDYYGRIFELHAMAHTPEYMFLIAAGNILEYEKSPGPNTLTGRTLITSIA